MPSRFFISQVSSQKKSLFTNQSCRFLFLAHYIPIDRENKLQTPRTSILGKTQPPKITLQLNEKAEARTATLNPYSGFNIPSRTSEQHFQTKQKRARISAITSNQT
jgi:hypothetical protein